MPKERGAEREGCDIVVFFSWGNSFLHSMADLGAAMGRAAGLVRNHAWPDRPPGRTNLDQRVKTAETADRRVFSS
jgi:hypothetical protein